MEDCIAGMTRLDLPAPWLKIPVDMLTALAFQVNIFSTSFNLMLIDEHMVIFAAMVAEAKEEGKRAGGDVLIITGGVGDRGGLIVDCAYSIIVKAFLGNGLIVVMLLVMMTLGARFIVSGPDFPDLNSSATRAGIHIDTFIVMAMASICFSTVIVLLAMRDAVLGFRRAPNNSV